MLSTFGLRAVPAQNLLSSSRSSARRRDRAALDRIEHPLIVGIAGDDTCLVIAEDRSGASALARSSRTSLAEVGDVARRSRRVTERDIELFTELTGDRNPLHYDEEAAARSRFGGLIVQGGVTSGLLNAVVAEDLPGPGSVFLHVD